ncbi:hypothetical protein J8273_6441 [Carpediemonas membranifera]|uniref:Uncharacterized protein n=1 Tax=Carpediemonas membranifera TaxID=201153 RepID=A0A8J6AT19_9EUKA|nr:hypothetical protein J8273_6441 [Carpediemonas membranifera]|eukprot:KAG9391670.1 hypothetical protein J8273_6441 [Carpediemonas membranifera]
MVVSVFVSKEVVERLLSGTEGTIQLEDPVSQIFDAVRILFGKHVPKSLFAEHWSSYQKVRRLFNDVELVKKLFIQDRGRPERFTKRVSEELIATVSPLFPVIQRPSNRDFKQRLHQVLSSIQLIRNLPPHPVQFLMHRMDSRIRIDTEGRDHTLSLGRRRALLEQLRAAGCPRLSTIDEIDNGPVASAHQTSGTQIEREEMMIAELIPPISPPLGSGPPTPAQSQETGIVPRPNDSEETSRPTNVQPRHNGAPAPMPGGQSVADTNHRGMDVPTVRVNQAIAAFARDLRDAIHPDLREELWRDADTVRQTLLSPPALERAMGTERRRHLTKAQAIEIETCLLRAAGGLTLCSDQVSAVYKSVQLPCESYVHHSNITPKRACSGVNN